MIGIIVVSHNLSRFFEIYSFFNIYIFKQIMNVYFLTHVITTTSFLMHMLLKLLEVVSGRVSCPIRKHEATLPAWRAKTLLKTVVSRVWRHIKCSTVTMNLESPIPQHGLICHSIVQISYCAQWRNKLNIHTQIKPMALIPQLQTQSSPRGLMMRRFFFPR